MPFSRRLEKPGMTLKCQVDARYLIHDGYTIYQKEREVQNKSIHLGYCIKTNYFLKMQPVQLIKPHRETVIMNFKLINFSVAS